MQERHSLLLGKELQVTQVGYGQPPHRSQMSQRVPVEEEKLGRQLSQVLGETEQEAQLGRQARQTICVPDQLSKWLLSGTEQSINWLMLLKTQVVHP